MAIQVENLTRVFKFNSVTLPCPGAKLTPDEVRDLYSASYPELTNAVTEGPETVGSQIVYTFKKSVGTKG